MSSSNRRTTVATITNTLVTALRVTGVLELRQGLRQAADAFQLANQFQGPFQAGLAALPFVFDALLNPLVAVNLALEGLQKVSALAGESLTQFSESERKLAPLAIELKNLGNAFPVGEAVEFADRMQDLTGISRRTTESLIATSASFGLTKAQIVKAIPTVLDIAQSKQLDPQSVLLRLLRASRGRPQGLASLGINPDLIKGDLHDINNLIEQTGKAFQGTAEAFRNTLPGTLDALQTTTQRFEEAAGRFFSPFEIGLGNLENFLLTGLTRILQAAAEYYRLPTAAALGKGAANPLALKGDPEQTSLLGEIAGNTAKLQPFIDQVLGGTGEVAGRSFSWRDARAAFGV